MQEHVPYAESCPVCADCAPKAVVVCMLYYLDEVPGGSWADGTLSALGYDRHPEKLRLVMRTIFERATSCIELGDVPVVPVPLYEALVFREELDAFGEQMNKHFERVDTKLDEQREARRA